MPVEPTYNEKELFDKIAEGDIPSYEYLYNAYYDSIYTVALVYAKKRELAEDVVQQLFLKLWEKRKSLKDVENPIGWMHNAAKYQVMNALDKEFNAQNYIKNIANILEIAQDDPADKLIKQQQHEIIAKAVQSLPEKQLAVYRLGREQGYTYVQIATELGIARETVKDYMAKALKNIRSILETQKKHLIIIFLIILKIFL